MSLNPRSLKRLTAISAVMMRSGFGYLLEGTGLRSRHSPRGEAIGADVTASAPERFRAMLEALGPTFVKLGQMLSMRPDILPPSYMEELEHLQAGVAPLPWAAMREVIIAELGSAPEDLFLAIEEKPVGSASIGQAYGARLDGPDGATDVVVKVQRPGIDRIIDDDLSIMAELAAVLSRNPAVMEVVDPRAVVDEFARSLRDELDFTREAANIERFRGNFSRAEFLHVPRVFWELTTPRVLVEERLEGLQADNVVEMERRGLDRDALARHLLEATMKQMLTDGLFHADPHPGNVLILDGGVIGLIDFGMVGRVTLRERIEFARLLMDIVSGDGEGAAARFSCITRSPNADRSALAHDFERLSLRYVGLSDPKMDYRRLFTDMLNLSAHGRCRMPGGLTMMLKALSQAADSARTLAPDLNVFQVAAPALAKVKSEAADPNYWGPVARHVVEDWWDLVETLPVAARRVLDKLDQGEMGVRVVTVLPEESRGVLREVGGLVAGSILMAGVFMGSILALAYMGNDEPWWDGFLPWLHVGFIVIAVGTVVMLGVTAVRGRRRR